ncbi:MAG TPA: enoyl-CoA hydratase/isomerase family protein [Hyphomicrobiaceae bacterium]|nr:enoyl-CoA hydratase/isomerase family protein [Hyphomicrobiaceae bacterium]
MSDNATDVLIRREGRAGRITLNRPAALNALTYPMVGAIWRALLEWQNDEAVALVILDGAGERGLCAGGDVRSLYQSRNEGSRLARRFWAEEYRLNALISRYRKPFLALQDGIVMGGGIGLSSHASHRLVTERSQLAMPETTIGLIPDVGGTWLLSRAPGETGIYLGLMGARMGAADAIYAGFSDAMVPAAILPELVVELCRSARPVDAVLEGIKAEPTPGELATLRPQIDAAFCFDTVEAIQSALAAMPGDWAKATLASFAPRSPLSLKATLATIRHARGLGSLEAALVVEYRLTVRLFEHGEFLEGVRALLVDKDHKPRWNPSRLEDVTPIMIARLMAPLPPEEELDLRAPTRF